MLTLLKNTIHRYLTARREDKFEWEFQWQQTNWLDLWNKPETKAKCLEYWRRFRHYDDITQLVPLDDASRVLDVGCGLSSVLHFLPGSRVGVDPLAKRYQSIYTYPFDVVAAPGECLPFPSNTFDLVCCTNCIDHTSDPAQTIKEIRRVMRPAGTFVLTVEVFSADLGCRNAGHPFSMTQHRLLKLVQEMEVLQHWQSPWYGMRAYVLGEPPTSQIEHILMLRERGNG